MVALRSRLRIASGLKRDLVAKLGHFCHTFVTLNPKNQQLMTIKRNSYVFDFSVIFCCNWL